MSHRIQGISCTSDEVLASHEGLCSWLDDAIFSPSSDNRTIRGSKGHVIEQNTGILNPIGLFKNVYFRGTLHTTVGGAVECTSQV